MAHRAGRRPLRRRNGLELPRRDHRPLTGVTAKTTVHRRLVIALAASYLATVYGGGWLKGDYNHVAQYTSELNATGTAWAWQIGALGFVFGLLAFALLWVAAPIAPVTGVSRVGYWLLTAEPVVWIGSALAPCDPGCPIEGSLSQNIHNLLGGTTYLVTTVGLSPVVTEPADFSGGAERLADRRGGLADSLRSDAPARTRVVAWLVPTRGRGPPLRLSVRGRVAALVARPRLKHRRDASVPACHPPSSERASTPIPNPK